MNTSSLNKTTGWLLIFLPLILTALFTTLGFTFDYPNILRQPAGEVLAAFQAGGPGLVATWYAMTLTALGFIPLVLLVHRALSEQARPVMQFATVFGLLAGLVQVLGFIRWPLLVPSLAAGYLDPAASAAAKDAIAVVFQAFNQYAGVAVGEHLGYLFTGLWSILLSVSLLKTAQFRPWLGWTGILLAAGVLFGMLEPAGVAWAGMVNFVAYTLWAFWLVALGVHLLRTRAN